MKREQGIFLLLIGLMACRKPFAPKVLSLNNNYLVVEGIIVNNPDSTIFKLSRTVNISSASNVNPVLNATVVVQDDQKASFPLTELGSGVYATNSITLDNSRKYKLYIKTNDQREYLSDLVAVKNSPPIDSVTYQITSTQVNFFSSTHDPSNNSRFYRWYYQETYKYYSPIEVDFIYQNNEVEQRTPAQQIRTCYIHNNSSNIILNSSAKLQQDVIVKNPITQVSYTLDDLKVRYSILVRQYALTPEGFNYYTNLAKNTEKLGSIFDAQPSEISGNIHCVTNPSEPVLGFICAGNISTKRIFVDRQQIPVSDFGSPKGCTVPGTIKWTAGKNNFFFPGSIVEGLVLPLQAMKIDEKGGSFSLPVTTPQCGDCTLKGTTQIPDFWIN